MEHISNSILSRLSITKEQQVPKQLNLNLTYAVIPDLNMTVDIVIINIFLSIITISQK